MLYNTDSLALIYGLTSIVGFLFLIGLLGYACLAVSDRSSARKLAIIGISLLLVCGLLQWAATFWSAQYGVVRHAQLIALGNSFFGILRVVALVLIVRGVFVGRNSQTLISPGSGQNSTKEIDTQNPYASTRV